jgi:predicted amidohydrolase
MPRTIKVAAVQMDAKPAPAVDRLQRVEKLVVQTVQLGAQLVVLPELFNTGYGYQDENYDRAEPIHGLTAAWMQDTAVRYHIHLAGSLMLFDKNEIYNALLLFAPDGRMWRYNKKYPWGWERAYFRSGRGITIAKTDLGDFGFMVCWDAAHLGLWRQYAGQIDMLVMCSCPPDVTQPSYHFQNGPCLTFDNFGKLGAALKGTGRLLFGDMLNQQTAWLGVPAVNTVGAGHLQTNIPNAFLSLAAFVPLSPQVVKYLPHANQVQLSCDFLQGCKIIDAQGRVMTELTQAQGETFTLAEVSLADKKPVPDGVQPKSLLPKISYLSSDFLLPLLTIPAYRRGLRLICPGQSLR